MTRRYLTIEEANSALHRGKLIEIFLGGSHSMMKGAFVGLPLQRRRKVLAVVFGKFMTKVQKIT